MKSKKGLTLIEVIVALAMLGIVSVLIFPAITNQFIMLRNSRFITADLYETQQEIEQAIIAIRQDIQAGVTPSEYTKTSYSLFGRTVGAYDIVLPLHSDNVSLALNTVVADNRMPVFPVANAVNVSLSMYKSTTKTDYAYVPTPSLNLKATYGIHDPDDVNLTNISRWYVSRSGFNSPMINNPLEIENGSVYPRFPEDYTIIPNAIGTSLNEIQQKYAGRHIIYTVTPASQSGKMGATVPSNPVFISGLPVIDGLKAHFDASMFSRESAATYIRNQNNATFVKQLPDISGNSLTTTNISNNNLQPELISSRTGLLVDNNMTFETYAKYLSFASNQTMSVSSNTLNSLNNITVFLVARNLDRSVDRSIISKQASSSSAGWQLSWTRENKLVFNARGTGSNQNVQVSSNTGVQIDEEWHIIALTSGLLLEIDYDEYTQNKPNGYNIGNSSALTFGSGIDIAEVIMFDRVLSAGDRFAVNNYLQEKYNPVSPDVRIHSLKPITASVIVNEPYTLPNVLVAQMTNGTLMNTPVIWEAPGFIDTSTAGIKTIYAAALSDPSKTAAATIDVTGVASLSNLSDSVMQFDSYTLPSTVQATLDNGKPYVVPVTWSPATVNTNSVGIFQYTGSYSKDPSKKMTLTLEIIPKSVSGVEVNTSMTLSVGQTGQLTATVLPSNAYNKNVTWHSSDPAIASVDQNGRVTASQSGDAVITVTTLDGGYTADCYVTVYNPVTGISLNADYKVLPRGSNSFQLVVTVEPETTGNHVISWSSSNNNVATVNNDGSISVQSGWGVSNGSTATITARVTDNGRDFTATCTIVVGTSATGISVSPNNLSVYVGATASLSASVQPTGAQDKSIIWQSTDPTIATVNQNGVVTGVSIGSTTITATSNDGNFTAQCTVTVTADIFKATAISGTNSSVTITFNKPVASATINVANTTTSINGNSVTFQKRSGSGNFSGNTDFTVSATAINTNETINFIIRRRQSIWSFN